MSICKALFSCCCHTCVCLSAVTRLNKLDIVVCVNHKLISWRRVQRSAVVRCADYLFYFLSTFYAVLHVRLSYVD